MNNVIDLSAHLLTEMRKNSRIDPATVPCRFSTLKLFAQSPLHYWHAVTSGAFEETLSMRIGSGAHAILFKQPYVHWTGKTRNGKAWEAFEQLHAGKTILNNAELAKAQCMADAIMSHATANRLLFTDTKLETRIDWEWQGRAFRSTPDAFSRTTLIDLKCLRSSEPDAVMWQSAKMKYHAQAALYRRCLNSVGNNIKDCFLVVVENKAPHPVSVFRFTETSLEAGDRTCALWMEQLRAAEAAGEYPGYTQTIVDLELPGDGMDAFTFEGDEETGQ